MDREKRALKEHIKKIEQEELKIATQKREKMKAMQLEIEKSNIVARAMKEEKIQKEKEEDLAIFRHVQQKQLAEQERQEMERRMREEKEREIKKLRDL